MTTSYDPWFYKELRNIESLSKEYGLTLDHELITKVLIDFIIPDRLHDPKFNSGAGQSVRSNFYGRLDKAGWFVKFCVPGMTLRYEATNGTSQEASLVKPGCELEAYRELVKLVVAYAADSTGEPWSITKIN